MPRSAEAISHQLAAKRTVAMAEPKQPTNLIFDERSTGADGVQTRYPGLKATYGSDNLNPCNRVSAEERRRSCPLNLASCNGWQGARSCRYETPFLAFRDLVSADMIGLIPGKDDSENVLP